MTYSQFIKETCSRLSGLYPEREAKAMAARLLQHYCSISTYEHMVEPFGAIAPEVVQSLENSVEQLTQARPLQYVLGWQEFCDLKIEVEEGVLIPRPETEELVMWVAEVIKSRGESNSKLNSLSNNDSDAIVNHIDRPLRILDMASGSGCIACALASKFPAAQVFACDISDKALEITAKNLDSCGCKSAKVFKCDLLNNAAETVRQYFMEQILEEQSVLVYSTKNTIFDHSTIDTKLVQQGLLDIIVSNPPYVTELGKLQMRPNILDYEPQEALFVPDANPLLFYKALRDLALEVLFPGGAIFMEINEQFASETAALFSDGSFSKVEIRKDIFDKPRMVMAVKSS